MRSVQSVPIKIKTTLVRLLSIRHYCKMSTKTNSISSCYFSLFSIILKPSTFRWFFLHRTERSDHGPMTMISKIFDLSNWLTVNQPAWYFIVPGQCIFYDSKFYDFPDCQHFTFYCCSHSLVSFGSSACLAGMARRLPVHFCFGRVVLCCDGWNWRG